VRENGSNFGGSSLAGTSGATGLRKGSKKSLATQKIEEDSQKLVFPLLKGYDDYDKLLKEILGDDQQSLEILNQIHNAP